MTCKCGRTFPDTFRECPKCGTFNPEFKFLGIKRNHWYVIVGIIILGYLNIIILENLNTPSPREKAAMYAEQNKRFIENVERHQDTILICENMNYREMKRDYIERATKAGDTIWIKEAWHTLTPDRKKTLAREYAACVSISKETKIRDAKTDQLLAEYSVREGFTDHEN